MCTFFFVKLWFYSQAQFPLLCPPLLIWLWTGICSAWDSSTSLYILSYVMWLLLLRRCSHSVNGSWEQGAMKSFFADDQVWWAIWNSCRKIAFGVESFTSSSSLSSFCWQCLLCATASVTPSLLPLCPRFKPICDAQICFTIFAMELLNYEPGRLLLLCISCSNKYLLHNNRTNVRWTSGSPPPPLV